MIDYAVYRFGNNIFAPTTSTSIRTDLVQGEKREMPMLNRTLQANTSPHVICRAERLNPNLFYRVY
jgi:hypothetical protein